MNASILSREDILNANDACIEVVEVEEWGGSVRVKAISAKDREILEKEFSATNLPPNMRARLVAMSVVDSNNNNLFTYDDIEALGKKNATAIDKIFTVAKRLSKMDNTQANIEAEAGN